MADSLQTPELTKAEEAAFRVKGSIILETFLRHQRTNPYYFFVGALFAAILGRLAVWISEFIPVASKVPDNGKPPQLTFGSATEDAGFQLLLTLLVFFIVSYLWLYFSRVFVYFREDSAGEVITFLLGFVSLATACCLPALWQYWGLILAVMMFFVALKNAQILWFRKWSDKEHPIRRVAGNGVKQSLIYCVVLGGIGVVQILFKGNPGNASSTTSQYEILSWLCLSILMVVAGFQSLVNSHKLFQKIRSDISLYAGQNSKEFDESDAVS